MCAACGAADAYGTQSRRALINAKWRRRTVAYVEGGILHVDVMTEMECNSIQYQQRRSKGLVVPCGEFKFVKTISTKI